MALGSIEFESDLYAAIEALQQGLDGLVEIIDLGPGWRFDFGSETSPVANGYERVSDTMNYDEERGYGFADGTDGSRDQEGPDDLRRDFILAYNKEFQLDLPDGDYNVRIITGSERDDNTSTYVLEDGEVKGGTGTAAGEFVEYTDTVSVDDGQLNILFAGEWARINAVEVVAIEDFNVKFDFGTDTSPVKTGFNQVSNSMVYDSEIGYGLDVTVDSRDRAEPDDIRRDFVIGSDYQFMVDLRNGTYDLKIVAGDNIASNKTGFVIEGEDQGNISSGSGQYAELETTVTVTDGQLTIDISEVGRINGLEVYYASELEESIDVSDLESLISSAKARTNEDGIYTETSFKALQIAIEQAEAAIETVDSEEALTNAIAELQTAIDGLEAPSLDVSELEELIITAKAITNDNQAYTEPSFEALQSAIRKAEATIETVDSEEVLANAISTLQTAMDSLAKAVIEEETVSADIKVKDEKATVYSDDIERLAEAGKFVIDLTDTDAKEVHLTNEQVNVLVNKKAKLVFVHSGVRMVLPAINLYADQAAIVSIEPLTMGDVEIPEEQKLRGAIYRFTIMQDEAVSQFSEESPVLIDFMIDEDNVKQINKLRVYHLNEDSDEWENIGGQYGEGVLSVTALHFSIFAPMEMIEADVNENPVNEEEPEEDSDSEQEQDEQKGDLEDKNQKELETEDGKDLPATATSIFNVLVIGLLLLIAGGIAYYVTKRRKSLE
ncbi:LPXTG cell wall anchor domain-containing protein [Aquibacillus rhizosphaerae]|uniref:LPXTG cell wall anchor domain-containing protein n=1 Tax=Aquibacillus rhizosphaerae TaxID=3051431 RepID=UPI002F3E2E71